MPSKTYVLITPARNEEDYIEKTIKSVISQTCLPKKWVIVSDGSTDKTDEIVERYIDKNDFIVLVKRPKYSNRNFGSKALAIQLGHEQLKELEYDYIGNLDADVSFEPEYYEHILCKFSENPKLGVAGGIRFDVFNGKIEPVRRSKNSVAGAFQLFRRQCYESIGGYKPSKYGGIDAIAEISSRMHGWEVESFPELEINHHRRTGTATKNILKAKFTSGLRDYSIGYHPLFQTIRCAYRITDKPFFLGSLLCISGYYWALLNGNKKEVSEDIIRFLRKEQMSRLVSLHFAKRKY
jgi:glycosyltransferase involved in cell wall biosynthesis